MEFSVQQKSSQLSLPQYFSPEKKFLDNKKLHNHLSLERRLSKLTTGTPLP